MTNQEAFDVVVNGLRKQGEKSTNKEGTCALRGEGGKKCAVGMLIPDDQYVPEMEERPLETICDQVPEMKNLDIELLNNLLGTHDGVGIDDWERGFQHIAECHNLNYTKVRL